MITSNTNAELDLKGVLAIPMAALCMTAIAFGYSQAVRTGILYTIYAIPFLVAAIILSALSMKKATSRKAGTIGLSVSIGCLAVSWLFAGYVLTMGLLAGLDPTITSDMGFLSPLNWE